MSKVKFGVFIGRFQVPTPHAGHRLALSQAAAQSEHLLVLVGSANACPSIKNPWGIQHRMSAVRSLLHSQGFSNFSILPLNDYPYSDEQWMADVRQSVGKQDSVTLFGHSKEGNDYLKWFPEWKFREVHSDIKVNATELRQKMFEPQSSDIPETVREDWIYYTETEPTLFKDYPFPNTLNFNCGDAVVICSGHVALIRRIRAPGRGCWALPGGFKNNDETFFECALRELEEETHIKVPNKILRGSVKKTRLFDSPKRSFGIPRNTLAVLFEVAPNPDCSLPKIRPADDASEAKWFPLSVALNDLQLYDDHAAILAEMTGVMPAPAYLYR